MYFDFKRAQLSWWMLWRAHHSTGSGGGYLVQGAVQIWRIVNKDRRGKYASAKMRMRRTKAPSEDGKELAVRR